MIWVKSFQFCYFLLQWKDPYNLNLSPYFAAVVVR